VAIHPGSRAPYAPTTAVLRVVERHRQFGLRSMDTQKLKSIGVTDALAPRTLASLISLGLYDAGGQITPEFEALRLAPEADFKPQFGEILRKAYSPVLELLDPQVATRTEIEDAFRSFEPPGMRPRMVQLFEGLMTYAGLRPERQRAGGGSTIRSAGHYPRREPTARLAAPSRTQPPARKPEPAREPQPSHINGTAPDGATFERRDVRLGSAGTVSIIVNVRWLDLSDEQFTALRKLIKDIEALGQPGDTAEEKVTEVAK
jgi:hypothetical protein